MRINAGVQRGRIFMIEVDGTPTQVFEGETLAAVLLALGRADARADLRGRPRGMFCNMGTCCECLVEVTVPGSRHPRRMRACLTDVAEGQSVGSNKTWSKYE
jgi:predicted molibdopterin-dependent oxidoreductase YjgC